MLDPLDLSELFRSLAWLLCGSRLTSHGGEGGVGPAGVRSRVALKGESEKSATLLGRHFERSHLLRRREAIQQGGCAGAAGKPPPRREQVSEREPPAKDAARNVARERDTLRLSVIEDSSTANRNQTLHLVSFAKGSENDDVPTTTVAADRLSIRDGRERDVPDVGITSFRDVSGLAPSFDVPRVGRFTPARN